MLLMIYSCSQEKEKVLDLSDVLPQSELYPEGKKEEIDSVPEVFDYDSLSVLSKAFVDSFALNRKEINLISQNDFLDRFDWKTKEKWSFINDDITLKVSRWSYSDSSAARNSFFNLIDCFGPKCRSMLLYERKWMSEKPFLLVLSEMELWFIEGLDDQSLRKVLCKVPDTFGAMNPLYLLTQRTKQRCIWWDFNAEENRFEKRETEKSVKKEQQI